MRQTSSTGGLATPHDAKARSMVSRRRAPRSCPRWVYSSLIWSRRSRRAWPDQASATSGWCWRSQRSTHCSASRRAGSTGHKVSSRSNETARMSMVRGIERERSTRTANLQGLAQLHAVALQTVPLADLGDVGVVLLGDGVQRVAGLYRVGLRRLGCLGDALGVALAGVRVMTLTPSPCRYARFASLFFLGSRLGGRPVSLGLGLGNLGLRRCDGTKVQLIRRLLVRINSRLRRRLARHRDGIGRDL